MSYFITQLEVLPGIPEEHCRIPHFYVELVDTYHQIFDSNLFETLSSLNRSPMTCSSIDPGKKQLEARNFEPVQYCNFEFHLQEPQ